MDVQPSTVSDVYGSVSDTYNRVSETYKSISDTYDSDLDTYNNLKSKQYSQIHKTVSTYKKEYKITVIVLIYDEHT